MTTPTPGPKLQFFANDGTPLVGGKLYTYAAGTTTPLATFADSGGSTYNANPVILDSRGEASVWLDTQSYKFKLTTDTDVEIWVVDNINTGPYADVNGIINSVLALLAASNGSSLIGYSAGNNGAAMTVQDKLRQITNIKDFGAVGDGVTDDTLAIQRAINSTNSDIILVPEGTFMVTGISLYAGKQLVGASRYASVLKLKQALNGNGMINAILADGIAVRNLTIDGNNFQGTAHALVNFLVTNDAIIENNTIKNCDRFAIGVNSSSRVTIRNNTIIMPQYVGAWIQSYVAGAGGPASQTGLAANVAGGGAPTEVAEIFYDTDVTGGVSRWYYASGGNSKSGKGYTSAPTITFPAVPTASAVARTGGSQVVAITMAPSISICANCDISHNYMSGGGTALSMSDSTVHDNFVTQALYGAGFLSEVVAGVGNNAYYANTVAYMNYNTSTSSYQGPDTDNTVSSGFEIWGSYERVFNNIVRFCGATGIDFGSAYGNVSNNVCYGNGQYYLQIGGPFNSAGINMRYGNASFQAINASAIGNKCYDPNGVAGAQAYGITGENALVTGLKIVDNDCVGNRVAAYNMFGAQVLDFRGRRLEGRNTTDPASIASGGNAVFAVAVPGLNNTDKWLLSCNFTGLTTEDIVFTSYYTGTNAAAVRARNYSAGAVDLPSGSFLVQAEEVIA